MDKLAQIPLTLCTVKVTLAAGSTTTLSSTGTVYFSIKGSAYSHAALSNTATPTTDWATGAAFKPVPANYGSVFTIGFDHSGNLKVVQGSVEPLDAIGAFVRAPQFGPLPDDFCPVGYEVIKCGSTYVATTTGWLFGTHDQSSVTGVTYTLHDVMTLPDRPQVA